MGRTKNVPWELNIQFDAHPDWKPLSDMCWVYCPLSKLTRIGEVCNCRRHYEESYGSLNCCPISAFAKKLEPEDTTNSTMKEISW